ncbi:MAG: peptidylprolyl isomerase [Pseudomonadota bacterium]
MMIRFPLVALLCLLCATPALAQNPFSAAVNVNNRAVTYWEIEQRVLFLSLLNVAGDLEADARQVLIDERLQVEAAERLGVTATDEELEEGLVEFAGRVNLSLDEFVSQIEDRGVAAQTFRDFVFAGITWRNVLRSQFGGLAEVTEEEVDRALALANGDGSAQVLLAEIVIPLDGEFEAQARQLIAELADTTNGSIEAFSEAAEQYSVAGSARQGGSLGYRPLASLPPALQSVVLPLPPGGVSDPVPLGQAIAIFQLRDFREEGFVSAEASALDYVIVPIPGGRTAPALAAAAELRDALDTCDDLYGVRPDGFERVVLPVEDVPSEIATELVALDDNEASFDLTLPDGNLMFLMLCGRSTELPEGARESIRRALFNQRLDSYADGFMAELRADALIRESE